MRRRIASKNIVSLLQKPEPAAPSRRVSRFSTFLAGGKKKSLATSILSGTCAQLVNIVVKISPYMKEVRGEEAEVEVESQKT